MSKQRDWVDYANLASNVAQNVQLHDVQQKLGAMAHVAANQERREMMKSVARREENQLREMVFRIATIIEDIKSQISTNPQPVLALARSLQLRFESNNINTESFSEWEDKQRLKKLAVECAEVIEQASAHLNPEQITEAERCASYCIERGPLNELIKIQKGREALAAKEAELKELQTSLAQIKCPGWFTTIIIVAVVSGAVSLLCLLLDKSSLMSFAAVSGAIAVGSLLAGTVCAPKELRQQQDVFQKIKALELELHSLQCSVEGPMDFPEEAERIEQLYMKFGKGVSSKDYTQMLDERQSLITKLLGEARLSSPL